MYSLIDAKKTEHVQTSRLRDFLDELRQLTKVGFALRKLEFQGRSAEWRHSDSYDEQPMFARRPFAAKLKLTSVRIFLHHSVTLCATFELNELGVHPRQADKLTSHLNVLESHDTTTHHAKLLVTVQVWQCI